MSKELKELIQTHEAEIKKLFELWRLQELQKIGSLEEKELTKLQERVNIYREVENRLLTLANK